MRLLFLSQGWPQAELHHVHASEKDDSGQERICVLMEGRVLQIVVVERDEDGEGDQTKGKEKAELSRLRVGEGGVTHQTRGVNHRQLVNELHRIYMERRIQISTTPSALYTARMVTTHI